MDFGELCAPNMTKRRVERVNNGYKRRDIEVDDSTTVRLKPDGN